MKKTLKILTVAALASLASGFAMADSITKPTTFASGTTIKSSEMNANFDTLYTQVNKIGSAIFTDSANKRISVGGNSDLTRGSLTIEADLQSSQNHHLVLINTLIPLASDGKSPASVIAKYPDGDLKIFAYDGGVAANSSVISFHRHGTSGGEVMRVHSNGNVGIGTTDPKKPLHVAGEAVVQGNMSFGPSIAANGYGDMGAISWTAGYFAVESYSGNGVTIGPVGADSKHLFIDGNGNIGMGTRTISYPLQMASGAYVTTGGTWTNASSRTLKDNITNLSLESAQSTLEKLNPVTFTYKKEKDDHHVGFIAEDVPDLVATKDRKGLSPMDIVAVVTKVVQEQQKTMKAQDETIQKQGKEIQALTAMLQRTLAGMSSIQQKVSQLEAAQQKPVLQKASYSEMVH